jgi:translation initiation factor IF-2
MAITCPRCGAGFDVTLFEFGHTVQCDCGARVDLAQGHVQTQLHPAKEGATMAEIEIGKVTHYFSKIGVAAIAITQDSLKVGDTIHVKGHTSDFQQRIDSIQLDNASVAEATAGQNIGIKVQQHARQHDAVFKVLG